MTFQEFIIHTGQGEILGNCFTNVDPSEYCSQGLFYLPHADAPMFDGAETYLLDGVPVPRPVLPLPEAHTLPAGQDWTLAGVPAGCDVWVDGVQHPDATDGDDLILMFPEPGVWPVRIVPPFPWRPAECEVTAT